MGRQLVLCPSLGKASSEGRARVGRGGARADEGKELKQKKKKITSSVTAAGEKTHS